MVRFFLFVREKTTKDSTESSEGKRTSHSGRAEHVQYYMYFSMWMREVAKLLARLSAVQ
jgi:hypothetical protein